MIKLIGIFIEPRQLTEIFDNIHNFFQVLPNVKLYFFCGKNLKNYYDSKLLFYDQLIIIELPVNNMTSIEYSNFLKTATFWEQFDAEYCLTIQTDGCLCLNSHYTIDTFLKYDFIGGYSKKHWHAQMSSIIDLDTVYPCLNGGFSLRNIKKCINVIKTFPPLVTNKRQNDIFEMFPEDIYFAYGMLKLGYNVGIDKEAVKFCTHTKYLVNTFCVHNFKKYASSKKYARFLTYCSQYSLFINPTIDTANAYTNYETKIEPHFIIMIITYYRKDETTIVYLNRSIDSLLNQQYKNWTLLIVGDNYEKLDEITQLIKKTQLKTNNNIIFFNNTIVERDTISPDVNKRRLWHCAGCTSGNKGLEFIRSNNFTYYVHLDDDDYWTNSHLKSLAQAYNDNPNCIFINTKSTHPKFNIIPNIIPHIKDVTDLYIKWKKYTPKIHRICHSALSFRCDILSQNFKTNLKGGIGEPSDGLMIKSIFEFIADNPKYYGICINKLTCFHDEELSSISNVKKQINNIISAD